MKVIDDRLYNSTLGLTQLGEKWFSKVELVHLLANNFRFHIGIKGNVY